MQLGASEASSLVNATRSTDAAGRALPMKYTRSFSAETPKR